MLEPLDSFLNIEKRLQKRLQQISRKNNLTISEWQLLKRIRKGEDTQSILAINTSLDVSTLSRQLARLFSKGFLKKKKIASINDHTRNTTQYILNDAGQDACDKMDLAYAKFEKKIFSPWTEEEYNLLKILLNRLSTSLDRSI